MENPLHVSSPLRTRVSVDLICRDCELEISRILLTVDLRVMDIIILRRITAYTPDDVCVMFQGDKHDDLPRAVYDSSCHGQLMGWLASLTLEDEAR